MEIIEREIGEIFEFEDKKIKVKATSNNECDGCFFNMRCSNEIMKLSGECDGNCRIDEKNVILNNGFCHVHVSVTADNVKAIKHKYPKALVLAHPECKQEVLDLADYIGSTSGIIDYATASDNEEF